MTGFTFECFWYDTLLHCTYARFPIYTLEPDGFSTSRPISRCNFHVILSYGTQLLCAAVIGVQPILDTQLILQQTGLTHDASFLLRFFIRFLRIFAG